MTKNEQLAGFDKRLGVIRDRVRGVARIELRAQRKTPVRG